MACQSIMLGSMHQKPQRGDRILEYFGATTAIFLSIIIVAAILRQRTGRTFQKMLLVAAAILLSAAVASNIAIGTLLRPENPESFIVLSKRI